MQFLNDDCTLMLSCCHFKKKSSVSPSFSVFGTLKGKDLNKFKEEKEQKPKA